MALRKIRILNDEILRKKCRNVKVVDNTILQILKDMTDTMYNVDKCGGLSAPQIGILKRLIVIDIGKGLLKLINPRIIKKQGTQTVVEGCLSIPKTFGKLKRPLKVTVQALDIRGKEITIIGTGLLAKCLCHEIDHLDGILFIDLVTEYL